VDLRPLRVGFNGGIGDLRPLPRVECGVELDGAGEESPARDDCEVDDVPTPKCIDSLPGEGSLLMPTTGKLGMLARGASPCTVEPKPIGEVL